MSQEIKPKQLKVPTELDRVENVPLQDNMFPFDGQWMPSMDASLIGPQNFKDMRNMRYGEDGVEGINGYVDRVLSPVSTYVYIKNGIHFRTNRPQDTYVVVHAQDINGNGVVLQNQTDIGTAGDFESTALWTDSDTDLVGRFSLGPSGSLAYANGDESTIWSGEEAPIGAMFLTTNSAEADPIDVSEPLANSLDTTGETATIDSTRPYMTMLTTRPIISVKVYVETPNTVADTLEFKYWNGSSYTAVSTLVDGTAVGGIPLAQTGVISFDSTVSTAQLHHVEDRYLYAYQMYLPSGSAEIYEVTCNMPMQNITNVWDGIYRIPIQCQVYTNADTAYEDFTLHVSESSTVNTPVGCIMDGFTASDTLTLMFEEQLSAVKMTMLGNLLNKVASVMTVKYWDGDGWQTLTITDQTANSGKTLSGSGLVSWTPPDDEQKQTLFSTLGYAYQITVSVKLTGTKGSTEEVVIDIINGIPASKKIEVYDFPVNYKNKLMMCSYGRGNQGNRIDYCANNAPDVWNGEDSSMDGFQSIYVGGVEKLTCAAQLFNRYGSNLFTTLIIFKNNEMFLLTGDGPLDYKLYPVSFTIGCPAPQTLATAESGFDSGADTNRNVVLWISHTGPMMFDGATIKGIPGLEVFFDPNENEAVNWDYLSTARGWFDSTYGEWNVLLPTGSSTELNSWFVYDMTRSKWFQKEVGLNDNIITGFNVIADSGDQYVYGGSKTGHIYQLETGTSWDGSPITYTIQSGDVFPSDNMWDITRIRRYKFVAKRITETGAEVDLIYSKNTDEDVGTAVTFQDVTATITELASGTAGVAWYDTMAADTVSGTDGVTWSAAPTAKLSLGLTSSLNRLVRVTENFNETGWCHNFKLSFTSSESPKGLLPIAWGIQWELVRKDEN